MRAQASKLKREHDKQVEHTHYTEYKSTVESNKGSNRATQLSVKVMTRGSTRE